MALKNDLAGEFVQVLPTRTRPGMLAQVLNHPVTDMGYYCSHEGGGWRIKREHFEPVSAPAKLPYWAYPAWDALAKDDPTLRPGAEYGPAWTHEVAEDTWYFTLSEGEVCQTVTLDRDRIVNIDYGVGGAIVGVEVI